MPIDMIEEPMTPTESAVPRKRAVLDLPATPWIVRLLSLMAFFAVWEAVGRAQDNQLFFVPFTDVVAALWNQLQTALFWQSYYDTLIPFFWGWMLALVIGIPFGLVIGRFRPAFQLSTPYLAFLNALPISTLVPVSVVLFGIGHASRILIVFLFAVVEIVLNTAAGVRYTDRELMEMARSFKATEWRLFRRIILPNSLPGIMAGVRIGTGRAVVGMVVVEILLVAVGVGKLILRYRSRFESADLYAVVLSLAIFGVLLLTLARMVEQRVTRWKTEMEKSA